MASLPDNDGALQIAIYSLGFFYSCCLQLRETLGGPCINYLKKGQSRQAPTLVGCMCWTTVGALIVVDVGGVLPLQQH